MNIDSEALGELTKRTFAAAGCATAEAERIARYLVESNLVGHDSHGVIRTPQYFGWMRSGQVLANQTPEIVFETASVAIVDGRDGFGQTAGEFATKAGIAKTKGQGIALVALRNSGHLGRIGDWATLAAKEGLVSLHFVSTSGFGLLVAPFGGIDRRLSANPISVGIPVEGRFPILVDISTCAIAEGKIKVARNKKASIPEGCVIDGKGAPTTDPEVFYTDPGAILPFGAHKGYGLGVVTEILAEALTGNGTSDPKAPRLSSGMLSIFIDPAALPTDKPFAGEVRRFIEFLRSSRTATPDGEILLPGEVEERCKATRLREGIPIDDTTWEQLLATAEAAGVAEEFLQAAAAFNRRHR